MVMDRGTSEAQGQLQARNGPENASSAVPLTYSAVIPAANRIPACAYCKRLKVRCERIRHNDPTSPCLRCTRSHRECVMVASKRRYPSGEQTSTPPLKRNHTNETPNVLLRRTSIDVNNVREQLVASWNTLTERDNMRLRLLEKRPFASIARQEDNVINQGLFTRKQVKQRLELYRNEIWPVCPVVKAPEGDNIEELFRQAPVLMHAILDVSSVIVRDPAQVEASVILHNIVFRTVIDEYMLVSMKNMELLKSLVLLILWYNESELYHQQRLRALTTLAVSLSYDLGLGGSMPPGCGSGKMPVFEQIVTPQIISDPYDPDCLNTWLSVYSFSFQETVANRRPVMSLWNSYTNDAVQRLETEFGPSSDRSIYHLWEFAKIRRLEERITLELFKKGNEPRVPDYSSAAVQYLIHHFDVEINALEPSIGHESPRRRISFLIVRAFLHQAILYADFDDALGRSPFTNFSLNFHSGPLTLQGAQSFASCFKSACEVLKIVASLTPVQIACMVNSFWSSVVIACDLVLKCRALCIFNRNYATASFISESELSHVTRVMNLGDEVMNLYPNDNSAVSYTFLIKLLICHHDARLHFLATTPRNWNLGDITYLYNLPADGYDTTRNQAVQAGVSGAGSNVASPNGAQPVVTPSPDKSRSMYALTRVAQGEGGAPPNEHTSTSGGTPSGASTGAGNGNGTPSGSPAGYASMSNGSVQNTGDIYLTPAIESSSSLGMQRAPDAQTDLQNAQPPRDMCQAYKLVPNFSPNQRVYPPSTLSDDSPDYMRTSEDDTVLQPLMMGAQQPDGTGDGTQMTGDEYPLSNVDDFWRDFMNQSIGPMGTDFQV